MQVLANPHRTAADAAGQGAVDHGVLFIELALAGAGLGTGQLCAGLFNGGALGLQLALGNVERRRLGSPPGAGLTQGVTQLGHALLRLGAAFGQGCVAFDLRGGVLLVGAFALQLRLHLGNRGRMLGQFRLAPGNIGFGGANGCFGFFPGRLIGPDIEAHQRLADADGLVVADIHLAHRARDLGGDTQAVGLQVGIVGALDKAPHAPPVRPPHSRAQQRPQAEHAQRQGFARPAFGPGLDRWV